MITKDEIQNKLLSNCLNCGYMDINFLIDLINDVENKKFKIKGEETYLFYVDREGKFSDEIYEEAKETTEEVEINYFIYTAFKLIINRINEIYDIDLQETEDFEIYTNCLDSHLRLKDEDLTETLTDIEQSIKDEVKAIIEHFN